MTSIEPIPVTILGWPYMPDDCPIADFPAYTQQLAGKLAGFTPGAASPPVDTGWTTVTPAAGYTAASTIQWRRLLNGLVIWRGRVQSTNFATTGLKTVATGLPASALPEVYTDSYCPLYANQSAIKATGLVGNTGSNLQVLIDTAGTGTPEINLAALKYMGGPI